MKLRGKQETKRLINALTLSPNRMSEAEKTDAILVLRNRVHEIVNYNQSHLDLLAKYMFHCSVEKHERVSK